MTHSQGMESALECYVDAGQVKESSPSGVALERKKPIVDAGETAPKGASGVPWICLQGIINRIQVPKANHNG